jgi:AMP deaminase
LCIFHLGNPDTEASPLFFVPTIKDYYVDLDHLLSVIADGPTKSFAYRRLKYLQGKWGMYTLLNEHQELIDMKVGQVCLSSLM